MLLPRILYQFPTWMQRLYPSAVWRGDTRCKCVYLSFDDGPVPGVTDRILDILDEYGVKASFFVVGENVSRDPDLVCREKQCGHVIGNHTYNHLHGFRVGFRAYTNNVIKCENQLSSILDRKPDAGSLFRSPYGKLKPKQKRWLLKRYRLVLWDVITHDYNPNYSPEKIIKIVRKFVRNGSIILFHDSEKAGNNVLNALPGVIVYLQEQGYEFRTLE